MTTKTFLPAELTEVRGWSEGLNEPAWLTELRLEALELVQTLPWPKLEKMNIERWNLDNFGKHTLTGVDKSVENLPEAVAKVLQASDGNLLIQRNATVVHQKVSDELAKQGVIFTDLHTAAQQHPDLVRNYLLSVIDKAENKATALHAALWSGGVFLYVPKNVVIEQPLQAIFITDETNVTFSPHILIVAEDNSRVDYVEHVLNGQRVDPIVHNGMAEVIVKAGAQVRFSSVYSLDEQVTSLNYRRSLVENDANIEWIIGEMNNGNTLSDVGSVLKGKGSSSNAKVISVGKNDQKLNVSTRAQHIGTNSDSQMLTRAVMQDESTGIFNGITKIEKGATNANGEQTERILMLSPKARGDANPLLLIDEDEVTAGHAASVGQVNAEHVYYLMARGISRAEAVRLIIHGFLTPIVKEIPIESVEERLLALVERKLERS